MRLRDHFNYVANFVSNPAVLYVTHHISEGLGGMKNIATQGWNMVGAPILKAMNPNVFAEIQAVAAEIKKNGGAKELLLKRVEQEKVKCAEKAKMPVADVDKLLKCILDIPESDDNFVNTMQDFASCAGINFLNFNTEAKEMSALATCISRDFKAAAKQAQAVVSHISKNINLDDFSKIISKIEKSHYLDKSLKPKLEHAIETCAHNIGEDVEGAHKKMQCVSDMAYAKGGMVQKIQAFVKCDNITMDAHGVDEMHNMLAFVSCIPGAMEDQFKVVEVAFDGSLSN